MGVTACRVYIDIIWFTRSEFANGDSLSIYVFKPACHPAAARARPAAGRRTDGAGPRLAVFTRPAPPVLLKTECMFNCPPRPVDVSQ